MSLTLPRRQLPGSNAETSSPTRRSLRSLLPWLFSWEIYLILLAAGFLRLYQLNTSEFDGDQAAIFGLAREAVGSVLLPLVSNRASIGIENPPAVIYLLMLPAALSANPLWAVVMVGLLNTLAVLLTYIFTRRYYGRFAGTVAALLYAAAAKPLNYSRFIWQQNMLAPVVVLFLFALFWGVVERRKGWLFPALLLLGLAYQLHETSLLLAIPLVVAMILAPGTLRWRDLALALVALLLLFSPYIVWEVTTHFSDLTIVLSVAKQHAHVKNDVIYLYKYFLSPYGFGSYDQLPTNPHAILRQFDVVLFVLRYVLLFLVIGGLVTAGLVALRPRWIPWKLCARWWTEFRADPYRCGLLLLLSWQIVLLIIFSRQTLVLYPYYLLILMPGPFMLMGIFLAHVMKGLHRPEWYWRGLRLGIYAVAAFTVLAQLVTCTATLIDSVNGTNGHGKTFNDLGSLQHALTEADQLAQRRHLKRVYIATDVNSQSAMRYLSAQMHVPSVLFDDARCFVLPNPADGPAVMLISPYAQLTLALMSDYAALDLIDQPARLGAPPFQLYMVSPRPNVGQTASPHTFTGNLQLVNVQRAQLNLAEPSWLISQWELLRSGEPGPRVTYNYAMTALTNGGSTYPRHSQCTFSALHSGDQLFVAFDLPGDAAPFSVVTLEGQSYTTTPLNPSLGFLHLETDHLQDSPRTALRTPEGKDSITAPLS